jgi:hypothetical protein
MLIRLLYIFLTYLHQLWMSLCCEGDPRESQLTNAKQRLLSIEVSDRVDASAVGGQ